MDNLSVIKYNVTDTAIAELKGKYGSLKIVDTASYEHVRIAIADVRSKRTGVEKIRKDLKADALEYGRKVDAEAKRLTDALRSIEDPLQAEKDRVDAEKERIRQEKARQEQERVDWIRLKIASLQHTVLDIQGCSSNEIMNVLDSVMEAEITETNYQEFTAEANRVKEEVIAALMKAYQDRVKAEKVEVEQKAEAERLAAQKKAQDEAQAKIDEENRKIQEEKDRIEAEKKAAQDKADREALEKRLAEEARVKAEADLKAKQEREAVEKARQEALKPDKEKLEDLAISLSNLKLPEMTSAETQQIKDMVIKKLRKLADEIMREVKNL